MDHHRRIQRMRTPGACLGAQHDRRYLAIHGRDRVGRPSGDANIRPVVWQAAPVPVNNLRVAIGLSEAEIVEDVARHSRGIERVEQLLVESVRVGCVEQHVIAARHHPRKHFAERSERI
jgi:hypothetical protein